MKKAWPWGGAVLALGLAASYAATAPARRLAAERAAAAREGVWTSLAEIGPRLKPARGDAAPLVRAAIQRDKKAQKDRWKLDEAARKTVGGIASDAEKDRLRRAFAADPDFFARWRAVAARPRLTLVEDWTKGGFVFEPERMEIARAGDCLAAAAVLGDEPRENLFAAARLSALLRQEPTLVDHDFALRLGRNALRAAERMGLGRETEAALGPPVDFRLALASELPAMLDVMEMLRTEEGRKRFGARDYPLKDRLGHLGPAGIDAQTDLIHLWRAAWRALPRDPQDYEGAARAMERHAPAVEAACFAYSDRFRDLSLGPLADGYAQTLRAYGRFEAERRAVRARG